MYAKLIVEKCFAAGKMTVAFARQPIAQRLLKGASANSNRKKSEAKEMWHAIECGNANRVDLFKSN